MNSNLMTIWDGTRFDHVPMKDGQRLVDDGLAQDAKFTDSMSLLTKAQFDARRKQRRAADSAKAKEASAKDKDAREKSAKLRERKLAAQRASDGAGGSYNTRSVAQESVDRQTIRSPDSDAASDE